MLFNSVHFLIFAPIVVTIYFLLKNNTQRTWLLIASLYFYAVFRVPFLLLLLFSAVHTYAFTKLMVRASGSKLEKLYLTISILGNLSILYFFKYIDFSFSAWNTILGLDSCDSLFLQKWGVILPMGISFFTLQAMSYSVDVHRKTIPVHDSLFEFILFLSFFPQLVAGPIIRAKDMLSQFAEAHSFQSENFYIGLRQMAMGFFKKTFVADPIGEYVDQIFASPHTYGWETMWIAGIFHAIQIYGDFSGYSDVAIGIGRIMGFQIPENFRRPFYSLSLAEFWTRWHISLSSWLRDYVYIPMGGSRVSIVRNYFNLFVTMFVSGLWHGAEWAVVSWGIFHAIFLILERIALSFSVIKRAFDRIPPSVKWLYPFLVFSYGLIFFRAKPIEGMSGIETAFYMTGKGITFGQGEMIDFNWLLLLPLTLLFGIDFLDELGGALLKPFRENRVVVLFACGFVIFTSFLVYSVTVSQPFVYFQF